MDGAGLAAKRQSDAMLSQAWHTEAFARQKRLKPLRDLLGLKPKRKAQTPDEMLAVLLMAQAGGAPLHFSEIN